MTTYDVQVEDRADAQAVAAVEGHVPTEGIGDFIGGAFGEVMQVLGQEHVMPSGPPYARYHVTADGFDVEAGFPVAAPVAPSGRVHPAQLPGGLVAHTMHRGEYAAVEQAYKAVVDWLAANGYVPAGDPWESYLDEPGVKEPRTLVEFPCRRA